MIATVLLLAGLAAHAELPRLRGDRLRAGTTCYSILRGGAAIGTTLQTIRASSLGNRRVWDIVVHQRHDDGSFDMRDHFVLDRRSLLPIAMDSRRGGDRTVKGWHRIAVRYAGSRVTGRKETAAGVTAIDVALDGPAWDGNLWGVTFAALPLRAGGTYTLPTWQYDKGRGAFVVKVVGSQTIDTPAGAIGAWALDAGDDPGRLVRYYVAQDRPAELGYRAGPFEQKPGGSCPG